MRTSSFLCGFFTTSQSYNLITGGNGFNKGNIFSKETKKKLSESRKGNKNPQYGKTGELATNYGITHTEETKKKMSDANTGSKNYRYNPFTINDITFDSTYEAARIIGCAQSTIYCRLKSDKYPEYKYINKGR